MTARKRSSPAFPLDEGQALWHISLSMKSPLEALATFGYLGRAPFAPGTFGTLGAVPLAWLFQHLGLIGYGVATFAFAGFAIWISIRYEATSNQHDASEIVIDEVAGGLIAFWGLVDWRSFVLAFVIFRLLDALKPFPVGYLDRNISGGLGVVLDDLAAGLMTLLLVQIILSQTSVLGASMFLGAAIPLIPGLIWRRMRGRMTVF